MKIKIRSKKIGQIILVLWVVFSIGYISYDQWNSYKEVALKRAYDSGVKHCVDSLILEAQKPSCDSISISNETETVDVVNIQCLSSSENGE